MTEPFHWSEEHEQFREVVQRMVRRHASVGCAPSPTADDAGERDLWRVWTEELGLQSLIIPEHCGGSGFSRLELSIAAEEMGRTLIGGPFFASAVLSAEALMAVADDPLAADWLGRLASGATAALAVVEESHHWQSDGVRMAARDAGRGCRLTGVKTMVAGGSEAQALFVVARDETGLSLFHVDPAAAGVERSACRVLDPSRSIARVRLHDAPATRVGEPGQGWIAVTRALEGGAVFLAAEQVGGSLACLDLSVEHARTRVQFGRPIGTFQAVKHRLADAAVRTHLAASAATWAAWQEPGSRKAALGAAVARAQCSQAYLDTALDTIQVHGGMGITWEHDAHRFLRRARADASVLPGPRQQQQQLEAMVGVEV